MLLQLIAITATMWLALILFASVDSVNKHYFRWLGKLNKDTRFWIVLILRLAFFIPTFLTLYLSFWHGLGFLATMSMSVSGDGAFEFGAIIGAIIAAIVGVGICVILSSGSSDSNDSDDDK